MLNYLKLYPTDHHSRALTHLYCKMIDEEIPELVEYLDSRFLCNTENLERLNSGKIVNSIIPNSLVLEKQNVVEKMLNGDEKGGNIRVDILDMPSIYHYNDQNFKELFIALA